MPPLITCRVPGSDRAPSKARKAAWDWKTGSVKPAPMRVSAAITRP